MLANEKTFAISKVSDGLPLLPGQVVEILTVQTSTAGEPVRSAGTSVRIPWNVTPPVVPTASPTAVPSPTPTIVAYPETPATTVYAGIVPMVPDRKDFSDAKYLSVGGREAPAHDIDLQYRYMAQGAAPTPIPLPAQPVDVLKTYNYALPPLNSDFQHGVRPMIDAEPKDNAQEITGTSIPNTPLDLFKNEYGTKGLFYPDSFFGLTSQGVYEELPPLLYNSWMAAGTFTAVHDVPESVGVTNEASQVSLGKSKTVIGSVISAVARRGATLWSNGFEGSDTASYQGALELATYSLHAPGEFEGAIKTDWRKQLWFIDTVATSLNQAFLGGSVPRDSTEDTNVENTWTHRYLNPTSAVVHFLIGASHIATVDNGKFVNTFLKTDTGFTGGNMGLVWANHILLTRWRAGQFTQIGKVRGGVSSLNLMNDFPEGDANPVHATDSGSKIRQWIGLEVRAPEHEPERSRVGAATGVLLADAWTQRKTGSTELLVKPAPGRGVDPDLASSSSVDLDYLRSAASLPLDEDGSGKILTRDRMSFYSARGPVVVGDGTADISQTGWNTDALLVRDAVRFESKDGRFKDSMLANFPESLQVGHIIHYAGDAENASGLYVSVPTQSTGEPVATWKRLKYEDDAEWSWLASGELAASGLSPALTPSVEVLVPSVSVSSLGVATTTNSVALKVKGFGGGSPRIFYRFTLVSLSGASPCDQDDSWQEILNYTVDSLGPEGEMITIGNRELSPPQCENARLDFLATIPETGHVALASVQLGQ